MSEIASGMRTLTRLSHTIDNYTGIECIYERSIMDIPMTKCYLAVGGIVSKLGQSLEICFPRKSQRPWSILHS